MQTTNFSLRWKILFIVLPLILVSFVGFTFMHLYTSRKELVYNTELFLTTLVDQLSFNIARSYEIENSRSLYQLVKEYVDYDSHIVKLRIIKQGGEITADSDPGNIFNVDSSPEVAQVLRGGPVVLDQYALKGKYFYKLVVPIYVWQSKNVNGALLLKYDVTRLFKTLHRLQVTGIVWSLAFIVIIAVVIAFYLERTVVGPLSRLTQYVSGVDIRRPDLPQLKIVSKDEVGVLSAAFRQLLEHLHTANVELMQRTAEIEAAYQQLKETQVQLIQSEKMASLGQLTAGIAHEVNNPMNFVYGNLGLIEQYISDLRKILSAYEKLNIKASDLKEVTALKNEIDYKTILSDLGGIISDCKTGAKRTIEIVQDLKRFSRMDSGDIQSIDINESINTTLKLLSANTKNRIEVKKEFGELPLFPGYAGPINQVLMNVIMNAIQAIAGKGVISIRTGVEDNRIIVEVTDTGKGIAPEIAGKIFDPFFTTKDVGKGTGLGLSISYRIVQEHHGTILFESKVGAGTCMKIQLPLDGVTSRGN